MLLFLNVCKQTFHISHVCVCPNLNGAVMWNLFMFMHIYVYVKAKI